MGRFAASPRGVPALREPQEPPGLLLQAQELLRRSRQRLPVQAQALVSVPVLAQRRAQEQLRVSVAAQERRQVLRQPELPEE